MGTRWFRNLLGRLDTSPWWRAVIHTKIPQAVYLVTMFTLVGLLILPVVDHYRYEQRREAVMLKVDPAMTRVGRLLELAHETRSALFLYAALGERMPHHHFSTARELIASQVQQLDILVERDESMQYCGPEVFEEWWKGSRQLQSWFHEHGPQFLNGSGAGNPNRLLTGQLQFDGGVSRLMSARLMITHYEERLLRSHLVSSEAQMAMVFFLGILCLAFASLVGWHLQRMAVLSSREKDACSQLALAVNAIDDRVRNNLQIIGALVDLQMRDIEKTAQRQALESIAGQVRAVSAVHAFSGGDRRVDTVRGDRLLRRLVEEQSLAVELQAEKLLLTMKQATALALIVNEILQFSEQPTISRLRIWLSADKSGYCLRVCYDGPDMDDKVDASGQEQIGPLLIRSLATHDLAGEVEFHSSGSERLQLWFPGGAAAGSIENLSAGNEAVVEKGNQPEGKQSGRIVENHIC